LIDIPSQKIILSLMNAMINYYFISALFNHIFLNLKNRDGFTA
jgi:hypothetical protein